jgi:ribosomal protein S17E
VSGEQLAENDHLIVALCEAIDPNWNKGAAVVERMSLDRANRVIEVVAGYLTSDDMVRHIQNWVPLGYEYPRKDPYPNVHEAARAILAEVASSLITPPGEVQR